MSLNMLSVGHEKQDHSNQTHKTYFTSGCFGSASSLETNSSVFESDFLEIAFKISVKQKTK
jgi:hypothetical protein